MKPTPQTNPNQTDARNFPLTDYSFQPTMEGRTATLAAAPAAIRSRPIYKLSSEFFATETRLDYLAELSLFVLIIGIAAWPVMSMLACLAWMKIVA
jgi:hypothetical protein